MFHRVGAMWRETQAFLTAHTAGREDEVFAAAATTFEKLRGWMTPAAVGG